MTVKFWNVFTNTVGLIFPNKKSQAGKGPYEYFFRNFHRILLRHNCSFCRFRAMKFTDYVYNLTVFRMTKRKLLLFESPLKYSQLSIFSLQPLVTLTLTKGQGHWSQSKVSMLCTYPANLVQVSYSMPELWPFQFSLLRKR